MKKVLAMILAVAMMLGCTSALAADAPKDAPVVKIFQNSGAGNDVGAEAGSTQAAYDMVQQHIYEQTGVWPVSVATGPSATEEKLNLTLAGGETIDLFWGDWREFADTGMIQPWNEYIEKYPKLFAAWDQWDAWRSVTDTEGNIWGMPRMTSTTPYQMFFRPDWLEALGMEVPSTLDEVEAYLYAVKDLDPYGNGLTVPLVCDRVDRLEFVLLGGFIEKGNGMWLDETDGLLKPAYLADGYLDFIKKLNQWYKDGIIHKEAFSWDTATVRDQINKGAGAATATWYSNITVPDSILVENRLAQGDYDRTKHPYPMVINENGIKGPNGNFIETRVNAGTTALMLHTNSENPEAALKLIEWQYENFENYYTAWKGVKDVMWRYDPEDPLAATETFKTVGWADEAGTKMYMNADGELSYDNTLAYFSDFMLSIGLPTEVLSTVYDSYGYQTMHSLWLQSHLDDYDVTMEPGDEYGLVWDTVALKDNVPASSDIETYVKEMKTKFIVGERPIEEWDAFIGELEKMGLKDVCEEYTRQYKIQKGIE